MRVVAGSVLPPLTIELTPTVVISTALATRDFTPVHHDPAIAKAQGSKDIFLNILTTMGLVERYVSDWAGPDARFRGIKVKLGVPAYAGDTLTFSGTVATVGENEAVVEVTGSVSLGPHVTASAVIMHGFGESPADLPPPRA
ncbi:MaoC/PaaZ C-terminal domain-containing protein [Planotetraspora kaengkrachanensis]|uniref:Beta-hydroxyacyl-ACP dehydratase n=1 Tax=Planotetraspora kaengkrachanensis TaxID=575193 RepID=A0A8J3VCS0_9ACTN|nr:MaoC/PaaZ C-terminal domain-containing protein [Planotetraspora kaengkrachanensis]GIG84749.1 beta-hydroxyacyl-ACP dehydratase [Planotetraspora kaengkrachanensis]